MPIQFGALALSAGVSAGIGAIINCFAPNPQEQDGKKLGEILELVSRDFQVKVEEIITKKLLEQDFRDLKEALITIKLNLQEYSLSPDTKKDKLEKAKDLATSSLAKITVLVEAVWKLEGGLQRNDNFSIATQLLKFLIGLCGLDMILLNIYMDKSLDKGADRQHMIHRAVEYQNLLFHIFGTLREVMMDLYNKPGFAMQKLQSELRLICLCLGNQSVADKFTPLIGALNKITGIEQREKFHALWQLFVLHSSPNRTEIFGKLMDYNLYNSTFHAAECFFKFEEPLRRRLLSPQGINEWDQTRLAKEMLGLNSDVSKRLDSGEKMACLDYWKKETEVNFNGFFAGHIRERAKKEMLAIGWKPQVEGFKLQ